MSFTRVTKWVLTSCWFAIATTAFAQYRIDIDSTDGGAISTESGWTSLDATAGNGGTVTVDGITFQPFSADGSRIRTSGGVPTPNDLTADFVFDDGAGQAVGLFFGGAGDLPAGEWQVKVWIWEASGGLGDVIVGYRTNNAETIVSNNVTADPDNPAISFTFTSDGTSAYDVFVRENNSENRARLNAVELSAPDGPTEITLTGNQISKSAAVGTLVGTLTSSDPTPGDTFTYSLVPGTGSGDNSRFAIMGERIELDSDLSGLGGGSSLSVRVRSTDSGGTFLEEVFAISVVNDNDNDGLDDDWELSFFPGLATASGSGNNDSDTLTNLQEQAAGTNPTLADTDADGLDDDVEDGSGVFNGPADPGSSPLLGDTDYDGIGDSEEISNANGFITDPSREDTDDDGYPDPLELAEGTDPTNGSDFPDTLLPLRLNEILANNVNGITDGFGNHEDWIEIYNPNNQAVDLSGYYLTDRADQLNKWTFPNISIAAQDYLLVFASGKQLDDDGDGNAHTNFSLAASGEYLAIVRPGGTVIDAEFAPTFPKQFPDISYGRNPSNSTPRYFDVRTPGAANNTGFADVVRDTTFSVDRGFYDAPVDVAITTTTPGASIRYTTDGTPPSETNGTIYFAPVPVTTTTTLRAIAYKPGALPTNVDTHTYIFIDDVAQQPASLPGYPDTWGTISQGTVPADYEMDPRVVDNTLPGYSIRDALLDIPTMSIVMPPGDFLGSPTSIYDHSTTRGAAYEKVCSLEYILPDGTPGFQQDCQIEMHGNSSRNPFRMQKHSFRVTFKAELGAAKLRYPLFPSTTSVDRFNKLVLRACFTDSWALASWGAGRYRPNDSQYIRDVWMKRSMGDMGHETSHGDFVHLYINGIYWGLHNPSERIEDDFLAEHQGGEKEDWEVNEDFRGADSRYQTMNNIDASTSAGYSQIQPYLDVENFADYMLLHFYGDAEDWPDHNGYAAANTNPANGDLKFRFYVWDQEIALDKFNWNRYNSTGTPGNLFQELRQRPEFRLLFADRVHRHLFNEGALSLESSRARYLELANRIDKAIVAESARWGDVQESTPYGNTPGSSTDVDNDNYPPLINDPVYFTREQHWVVERDNVINHHLTVIHDETDSRSLVRELRAANLYPSIDAPEFTQHGGFIPADFELHMDAGEPVWYTTNGEDPRLPNGSVNPAAQSYLSNASTATETLVGNGSVSPTTMFSLVPSDSSLALAWTKSSFTETGWETSTSSDLGAGYERTEPGKYGPDIDRNLRLDMLDTHPTAYLRYEFNVADASAFTALQLEMKYDDGYVVYLNGVEIDSRNSPATPAWDSISNGSHEHDDGEGFSTLEAVGPALLQNGLNVIAIHGMNAADNSSDFIIEPRLSGTRTVPDPGTDPILLNGSQTVKARSLAAGGEWSALTEASFVAGDLVISEMMYHPAGDGNSEFIELLNIGAQTINLEGIAFTDGILFEFGQQILGPGERILVVRDLVAFAATYGAGLNVAGAYTGGLSNDGETVQLEANGALIRKFTYNDVAPWPQAADGEGRSLVLIAPSTNPNHALPQNWRHSTAGGGSPSTADSIAFSGDPLADLDGNGQADLVDYALGDNFTVVPGEGANLFTIPKKIGSDDVEISIELSNDLNDWTDLGSDLPVVANTVSGDIELITFELSATFGNGGPRLFLRTRVSLRD